jgi:cell division protein FtsL
LAEYLYGNAVYNYGSTAPAEVPVFPEREEQTPRPEAVPRPREQEVVRTGVVAEPRSRVQMSLFVLVFAPVLLLSAVMLLFSYMKLNTLSDQSAAMVTQLQELKEDQTRLKIKYESTFDLAEVETYAKTVLGMVKAGADQTTFVRSTEGDRAQVLTEQKWYSDWERRLDSLARKVQAYFR